ncbi:hypothetical protein M9Y10_037610 [Tritrichomonas musculus]|uniref:Ubiquitin-like domain-containing protein n=1 Tax=Tritrichomonas musculus TaxID=1915356 RepID=A0ABR2GSR4_9EUKA
MINGELFFNDGQMAIYVYQPFIRFNHIRLNKNSSISVLNNIYPKDSIYIYSGQILDVSKSFVDYDIKEDNKIVLFPSSMKKQNPNFINKWLRLTNNKEQFEEIVNLNKSYRNELARLQDIKRMKKDLKRRNFYSTHKTLNSQSLKILNQIYENSKKEELNVEYDSLNTPAIDPLPIIW